MNKSDIYDFFLMAQDKKLDLIVRFFDGDKYHLSDIDLAYSIGMDGGFDNTPLEVNFCDCRGVSKKIKAKNTGPLKLPGIGLANEGGGDPVSATYGVEDVASIFDETKQYILYEGTA